MLTPNISSCLGTIHFGRLKVTNNFCPQYPAYRDEFLEAAQLTVNNNTKHQKNITPSTNKQNLRSPAY